MEKIVGCVLARTLSLDYETVVTVKQGSLVDFAITPGPGTDTGYDATNFTVRIERSPG
jgi:hypothetical protein